MRQRYLLGLIVLLGALALAALRPWGGNDTAPVAHGPVLPALAGLPVASRSHVLAIHDRMPMPFEANQGQTDSCVKFLSRSAGCSIFLTSSETVLTLQRPCSPRSPKATRTTAIVRMKLVGANPAPRVEALAPLPGKVNYLIGSDPRKWRTGVSTYARVKHTAVYPGIDLVHYGDQRQLEYDFVVAPGADPAAITLAFSGARKLELDPRGDLLLHTAAGTVRQHKPRIYQPLGRERRAVAGGWVLRGRNRAAFRLARYDTRRTLVIDPTLTYATYLGGSGDADERPYDVTLDAAGALYVTGRTNTVDFPTRKPLQPALRGGYGDAFVTKLAVGGSSLSLLYSTYVGGSDGDAGLGIAADAAGSAYVTGYTFSVDFPTTPGALKPAHPAGDLDAFVAKLSPAGDSLLYSTFLGAEGSADLGYDIAVDPPGSAYVTGETRSLNFPTTPRAFQPNYGGGYNDAFVAKLNASGSALLYSSYLGGSGEDASSGHNQIVVDAVGYCYLSGSTMSRNFPTTPRAYQPTMLGGTSDAFVAKVNAAGSNLIYSTYVGGREDDYCNGLAVDESGNAYLTGLTQSPDFRTTLNAFQRVSRQREQAWDAFLTKLSPDGSTAPYSTYFGGSNGTRALGVALGPAGRATIVGLTFDSDLPLKDAFDKTLNGNSDAFVAQFDTTAFGASSLIYSSYFGGTGQDDAFGIACDGQGNCFVVGYTNSADLPTTPGALQPKLAGGYDTYIAWVADTAVPSVELKDLFVTPAEVTGGADAFGQVTLTGPAPPGVVVASSSENDKVAIVPATLPIPVGSSTATFRIATKSVMAPTPVEISASWHGVPRKAQLTVIPEPPPDPFGKTRPIPIKTAADIVPCRFTAQAGDVILGRLSPNRDLDADPDLRLFAPDGSSIARKSDSYTVEITHTTAAAGVYTFLAGDAGGDNTGVMGLFVQRLNRPGNAVLLPDETPQTGMIKGPAQMDTYVVDGVAGQVLVVRLSEKGYPDIDPEVRLYDPSGKLLDSKSASASAEITWNLTATGRYTILAGDTTGRYTGAYTISAAKF